MSGFFLGVSSSARERAWRLREADERLALAHAQRLGVPEIVGRLLAGRGVALERGERFLNPSLRDDLPDPATLADLEKAADRLAHAVINDEKIAVFGDYDVDGATSSALLARWLRALGRELRIYIPDRMTEGYGPNAAALQKLAGEGIKLVITVDCGTAAHAALEAGKAAGLDIIVCDHHLPGREFPPCFALVNPNRTDDSSGAGTLAAVGVTFMLLIAATRVLRARNFFAREAEPDLRQWLDLVALGTVCDVAQLTGINRALVAQGLKVMNAWRNPGLAALRQVARLNAAPSVYELGFMLGPRINAGGRVGSSSLGVSLLTADDPQEALALALKLDLHNRERQTIESAVMDEAVAEVERKGLRESLAVAANARIHPGVAGIVASRLVEKFKRPALALTLEGETAKGSGRSIKGVDLGSAVHAAYAEGLLLSGGGHAMAAGLTVERAKLPDAIAFIAAQLKPQMAKAGDAHDVMLDGALSAAAVSAELLETLARVGPYGPGNPEPLFALASMAITYAEIAGTSHVRLRAEDEGGRSVFAIAFRAAETGLGRLLLKSRGRAVHLAGKLRANDWNGRTRAELHVEDAAAA